MAVWLQSSCQRLQHSQWSPLKSSHFSQPQSIPRNYTFSNLADFFALWRQQQNLQSFCLNRAGFELHSLRGGVNWTSFWDKPRFLRVIDQNLDCSDKRRVFWASSHCLYVLYVCLWCVISGTLCWSPSSTARRASSLGSSSSASLASWATRRASRSRTSPPQVRSVSFSGLLPTDWPRYRDTNVGLLPRLCCFCGQESHLKTGFLISLHFWQTFCCVGHTDLWMEVRPHWDKYVGHGPAGVISSSLWKSLPPLPGLFFPLNDHITGVVVYEEHWTLYVTNPSALAGLENSQRLTFGAEWYSHAVSHFRVYTHPRSIFDLLLISLFVVLQAQVWRSLPTPRVWLWCRWLHSGPSSSSSCSSHWDWTLRYILFLVL